MSEQHTHTEHWQRECVVAAFADLLCPVYRMPCWVCVVLHGLTGVVRSVTYGRFSRFCDRRTIFFMFDPVQLEPKLAQFGQPTTWRCVHSPGRGGDDYWNTRDASATDMPEESL